MGRSHCRTKLQKTTRSTGTVHTFAKGRWRNEVIFAMAMIAQHGSAAQRSRLIPLSISPNSDESGKQSLYPDGDPDRHQNLIFCSLAHCQPFLKISCKSVWEFCAKLLTDKQTDKQRRKHNLLGWGNHRSYGQLSSDQFSSVDWRRRERALMTGGHGTTRVTFHSGYHDSHGTGNWYLDNSTVSDALVSKRSECKILQKNKFGGVNRRFHV